MATLVQRGLTVDCQLLIISVAGPNPYVTGGFDPGFPSTGVPIAVSGGSTVTGGTTAFTVALDPTNKKVKVMQSGGAGNPLAEVGNGTNLSGSTFNIVVYYKP